MILTGDCRTILPTIPTNSVDCVVTSPPYYRLRDYGIDGQIGKESSPQEYITTLTDIFREIYRVLKSTGTCWINIGDTYSNPDKNLLMIPARLALSLQEI